MSQLWSIFKHMLENTVHFQTHFEKIPLPRTRQRPGGAASVCLKMDRIFKHLFENGPCLAHPIFKVAIRLFFKLSPFSRGRKLPQDELVEMICHELERPSAQEAQGLKGSQNIADRHGSAGAS